MYFEVGYSLKNPKIPLKGEKISKGDFSFNFFKIFFLISFSFFDPLSFSPTYLLIKFK